MVDDRVQGDSGLTRLAVSNDELTLTTTDRNHRVDSLQAGLQGLMDRLTHHDARSLEFQCAAPIQVGDFTEAIDRTSQRIHRTTQIAIANGDRENLAGTVNRLAFFDRGEITENNGTDLALFKVHRQAQRSIFETQKLVRHGAGKALNASNTVGSFCNVSDLVGHDLCGLVRFHERVERRPYFLGANGQISH